MPNQKTDSSHLRSLLGHVNFSSMTPAYVQIKNMVRFAIATGKLKAGERLPTIRELSAWLDLNPNTNTKAYRDLEVMGLIWTGRGRGIFVNKGIHGKCRDKVSAEIISRIFEVCSEAKAAGMTTAEIKALTKACYKAAGAPYSEVPKEIMELAKRRK